MCHASDVVVISHGPDHIAGLISYKTLYWESRSHICLIGKYTIWPICSWMLATPWPSFNKSICSSAVMLQHLPPWLHGTVASSRANMHLRRVCLSRCQLYNGQLVPPQIQLSCAPVHYELGDKCMWKVSQRGYFVVGEWQKQHYTLEYSLKSVQIISQMALVIWIAIGWLERYVCASNADMVWKEAALMHDYVLLEKDLGVETGERAVGCFKCIWLCSEVLGCLISLLCWFYTNWLNKYGLHLFRLK